MLTKVCGRIFIIHEKSLSSVNAKIKKMSIIELYIFTKSCKNYQETQNLRVSLNEKRKAI